VQKYIPHKKLICSGGDTVTETKLYVGLNDSVTMTQEFDTEKYVSILKNVCRSYHVSFSFSVQQGGYVHEDGQ